jgi:multiple sugar transport system permease protein
MRKSKKTWVSYILLVSVGIVMFFPFYWLVRSAFMDRSDLFALPIRWFPRQIVLDNFIRAFTEVPFLMYFRNTLFLVCVNVVGAIFSSSFAAYGFAKINFPTRNFWFTLVLASMMLPNMVAFIPQFIEWKLLGGYNTYLPLTVPAFFAAAFNVFLIRQFYAAIPMEYDEAAVVDGAGYLTIYWKLMLPMSKPVLTTVGVATFIGVWNDYVGPSFYLNDESKWTLSLALRSFQDTFSAQWEMLMASAAITIIPVIILFFFTQKAFIEGANFTGVKG